MGPLPIAMGCLIKSHCLRYRLLKIWGFVGSKRQSNSNIEKWILSPAHPRFAAQSASLNQLCQVTNRRTMEKLLKLFLPKASIRNAIRARNKMDKTQRTCQAIHVSHSNAFVSSCWVTEASGYPTILFTQWCMFIGFPWLLTRNWRESLKIWSSPEFLS